MEKFMSLRTYRLPRKKSRFTTRRWAVYLLARFAVAIACTSSAAAADAQLERGNLAAECLQRASTAPSANPLGAFAVTR
jgi:hypothetical protein